MRSGLCEGAVIDKTWFEDRATAFALEAGDVWLEADEGAPDGSQAMLGVAVTALLLATLPALIGTAILLGTTVPLEFGGAAALAIVACIKLAAGASGIVAAIRAPQPARPATRFD